MWKRFALGGAVVVLLSAVTTATAGLLEVKNVTDELHQNKPIAVNRGDLRNTPPGAPQTILLIGSDKRAKGAGPAAEGPAHSDTMILVRVDPDQQATTMLSVPRDLKTTIDLSDGRFTTQKINAAFSLGGARLALHTVRRVLQIPIDHVVEINFRGFKEAVDRLGCVYTDVDRRYLNNHGGPTGYAVINLLPGYQKLCGEKALDFARYRHTDTDLVRSARQQSFLREAKQQIGADKLFSNRHKLEHIFGKYTQSDLRSAGQVLELLKLLAFSAGHPVRQVPFKANLGPSFVTATPAQLSNNVRRFLHGGNGTPSPPRLHRRKRRLKLPRAGRSDVAKARGIHVPFPVYFPRRLVRGGGAEQVRSYTIGDEHHHVHQAYRVVVPEGSIGQYYGIEGMNWTGPPILKQPDSTTTLGGRTLKLYYNGKHLRLVAWQDGGAVYWLANSLTDALSNKQMLAIALSAKPLR